MSRGAFVFLALTALSTVSFAATIHVPTDQPTIQAGIDVAIDGDTVLVAPGTYVDQISVSDKVVHVVSSGGSGVTFFTWSGLGTRPILFNKGGTLSGFTWQNQNVATQGAIRLFGGDSEYSVEISSCVFRGLITQYNFVEGDGRGKCRLSGNVFADIFAPNVAVIISDSLVPSITNNTFYDAGRAIVIYVNGGVIMNNIISRCTIYGYYDDGYTASERFNCYWANTENCHTGCLLDETDLVSNPQFVDESTFDFRLLSTSPCIDAGCPDTEYLDADNTQSDIGAFPYVNPRVRSILIGGEANPSHLLDHSPSISWTYTSVLDQQELEIEVGTDPDWSTAESWDPLSITTNETAIQYGGTALLDGQTYYLRVRIRCDSSWSEWCNATFHMNSAPAIPTLLSPVNRSTTTNLVLLTLLNSVDPESDPVQYDYHIFGDSVLLIPVDSSSGVIETPGQTSWTCAKLLTENAQYWWRSRAFDGSEYTSWSPPFSFWINDDQQPPMAPDLLFPPGPTGLPVLDLRPTFYWTPAVDPDPLDTVHYRLDLSLNSIFQPPSHYEDITADSLILPDSLDFGTRYWWRVRAFDKTGLYATSTPSKSFWTWQLGDLDNSHNCDIADLSRLIDYLYISFSPIVPLKIADLDGDCHVDISDLSKLIDRLYISFTPLSVGCEP